MKQEAAIKDKDSVKAWWSDAQNKFNHLNQNLRDQTRLNGKFEDASQKTQEHQKNLFWSNAQKMYNNVMEKQRKHERSEHKQDTLLKQQDAEAKDNQMKLDKILKEWDEKTKTQNQKSLDALGRAQKKQQLVDQEHQEELMKALKKEYEDLQKMPEKNHDRAENLRKYFQDQYNQELKRQASSKDSDDNLLKKHQQLQEKKQHQEEDRMKHEAHGLKNAHEDFLKGLKSMGKDAHKFVKEAGEDFLQQRVQEEKHRQITKPNHQKLAEEFFGDLAENFKQGAEVGHHKANQADRDEKKRQRHTQGASTDLSTGWSNLEENLLKAADAVSRGKMSPQLAEKLPAKPSWMPKGMGQLEEEYQKNKKR